MGEFVDLTGKKFNKLTVLKRADIGKGHLITWECKCECGNICYCTSSDLNSGHDKSCGCGKQLFYNSKLEKMLGQKYGRLLVVQIIPKDKRSNPRKSLLCQCDCGKLVEERPDLLKDGRRLSCGCRFDEYSHSAKTLTHGMSDSRVYKLYGKIKTRCYSSRCREYKNYGGRGIKMCKEWLDDPSKFMSWAYENGYDDNAPKGYCTLDRINVDGDYSPDNCRFISNQEQQNNRRDNVNIQYQGTSKTVAQWAREFNITYSQAHYYLVKQNKGVQFLKDKYKQI